MLKRINVLAMVLVVFCTLSQAQNINSPYSRYGLGDLLPSQNILNRGMGGVSTAYYDHLSLNYHNPASYGRLQLVTLDFGFEVDNLTIRALNPSRKYSNASPLISYINLGLPIIKNKKTKAPIMGLVAGLRPMTQINYKILRTERLTTGTLNDSVATLFEGNGGSQQVYLGTGIRLGNFAFGFNAGYLFGSKDYSTRRIFLNDTVTYYKSNHQTKANFNGFLYNAGIQYTAKLGKNVVLRLGAQGRLEQELHGEQDVIRESFEYDANQAGLRLDSVYQVNDQKGDVALPVSYSVGFILDNSATMGNSSRWMIGVDYSNTKWSKYKFFNEQDAVQDTWDARIGGQMIPVAGKSYWSNVAYRAGFMYGVDYVNVDNVLPKWSISFGAGLPMRKVNYSNQTTIINTSFEIGKRGNSDNAVQESFFRFSLGLSMSDLWFMKRKYD